MAQAGHQAGSGTYATANARGVLAVAATGFGILAILWAAGALGAGPALAAAAALGVCVGVILLRRGARRPPPGAETTHGMDGRQAAALLVALTDSLPDPLLLLDARGWVVEANAAARRLLGARMAGRPLASVLRNPALLDAIDALLRGREADEVAFSLPVPVERHLRATLSRLEMPARAGEATAPAVIVVLHDVTDMRRMEQMRVDFVANVSHELRTPLSILSGFIETLRGPARDDPEAQLRFLDIMADQARRMARLVDGLLSLSRIEMDEHRAPTGTVDLGELARAVAAALQPVADAATATLRIDLPAALPAVIGDRDQLFQVLQNLMDNAIKYGGPEGEVTVEAGPPAVPGHVAITIRDRGEGIPRAHIPRLTERFYRIDPARSRERGGTGLGLAIVKHVINRHNGRLTIESTPGQGSAFTISLPAALETPPGPRMS